VHHLEHLPWQERRSDDEREVLPPCLFKVEADPLGETDCCVAERHKTDSPEERVIDEPSPVVEEVNNLGFRVEPQEVADSADDVIDVLVQQVHGSYAKRYKEQRQKPLVHCDHQEPTVVPASSNRSLGHRFDGIPCADRRCQTDTAFSIG